MRQLLKAYLGVARGGHADGISRFFGDIGNPGAGGGDAAVNRGDNFPVVPQIGYPDPGIEGHAGVGKG
jgi:hypothetical protein